MITAIAIGTVLAALVALLCKRLCDLHYHAGQLEMAEAVKEAYERGRGDEAALRQEMMV